jgi:hypothetical protein
MKKKHFLFNPKNDIVYSVAQRAKIWPLNSKSAKINTHAHGKNAAFVVFW